jgi:hypothetical protein
LSEAEVSIVGEGTMSSLHQGFQQTGRSIDTEAVLDAAVPHPWIGRQLFALFRRAGLRDVRVVPHVICLSGASGFAVYEQLNRGTIDRAVQAGQITAQEVTAWWAPLTQAAEAETFFAAVLGFTAAGRKP